MSGAQVGTVGTVDARVESIDAKGRGQSVVPEWTRGRPRDGDGLAWPGNQFRITVTRPGESKLTVAANGVSKELAIKSKALGNAVQVEIVQQPAKAAQIAGSAADPAATPAQAPDSSTTAAPGVSALPDDKARHAYALGIEMGAKLMSQFPELDRDLVARGLRDSLAGNNLLTEGELTAALTQLRYETRTKQVMALKGLAEKNKQDGEAFLTENGTKEGVVTLESGLQYKILKAGDGRKPTVDDTVVCNYRGTLVDGTEFDSSRKRAQPATFALKRMIKGWSQALQLMPVGSKWQVVIPPGLAYGAKGAPGTIGPNATLVFDVELLSIKDRPATATTHHEPSAVPPQSVANAPASSSPRP